MISGEQAMERARELLVRANEAFRAGPEREIVWVIDKDDALILIGALTDLLISMEVREEA